MNPEGTGKTFVRSLLSTDFPDGSGARSLTCSPSGNIYTFDSEEALNITDDVNPNATFGPI